MRVTFSNTTHNVVALLGTTEDEFCKILGIFYRNFEK